MARLAASALTIAAAIAPNRGRGRGCRYQGECRTNDHRFRPGLLPERSPTRLAPLGRGWHVR